MMDVLKRSTVGARHWISSGMRATSNSLVCLMTSLERAGSTKIFTVADRTPIDIIISFVLASNSLVGKCQQIF